MQTLFVVLVRVQLVVLTLSLLQIVSAAPESNSAGLRRIDRGGDRTRIAIVVCLFNAGISTRGLEIAKALTAVDDNVEIRFFSWNGPGDTSSYHDLVRQEGFDDISDYGKLITQALWNRLLADEHSGRGFRDVDFLKTSIRDCVRVLKEFKPHVIVHGLQPDATVAAQILGIPDVQYGPIPIDKDYVNRHLLTDLPDALSNWFTNLWPRFLRVSVLHWMLRQQQKKPSLVYKAAIECGWKPKKHDDWNVYNSATRYLVTDLPSFYSSADLPSNVRIIGPLFAAAAAAETVDDLPPEVQRVMELSLNNKPKVLVTMGSTGTKAHLTEAVQAVCSGDMCAVVALPPNRCTIREILKSIDTQLPETVVLTESFLPARQLASWADVVVSHGGQGTVQTALASGTPIVGIGLQFEQEWNLENVVKHGAGIRLPKRQWHAKRIRKAIQTVMANESYRWKAEEIAKEIEGFHSAREAAAIVLQVAQNSMNEQ